MAYDTELADRIREILAAERGVDEKRMFGAGVGDMRKLRGWVDRGVTLARTLPAE